MRAAARGGRSGYRAVQGGTPLRPSSSTVQGGAKGGGLPFPLSDPFFDDWSSRNNSGGSDNCHNNARDCPPKNRSESIRFKLARVIFLFFQLRFLLRSPFARFGLRSIVDRNIVIIADGEFAPDLFRGRRPQSVPYCFPK